MPAPTAPLVTRTISFPDFRNVAICVTSCSNCAGSICFRLSVSTPVPSLTTRRETDLSESRCTHEVKTKSTREKRRKWLAALQAKQLQNVRTGFFLVNQRVEEAVAA